MYFFPFHTNLWFTLLFLCVVAGWIKKCDFWRWDWFLLPRTCQFLQWSGTYSSCGFLLFAYEDSAVLCHCRRTNVQTCTKKMNNSNLWTNRFWPIFVLCAYFASLSRERDGFSAIEVTFTCLHVCWSIGTCISTYVQLRHSSGAPVYVSPLGFLITFELLRKCLAFLRKTANPRQEVPNNTPTCTGYFYGAYWWLV